MPRQLGTGANQNRFLPPPQLDGIIGHQAMATHDQVEGALALSDAAFACNQHAETEDVHQHGVDHRPLGERILED